MDFKELNYPPDIRLCVYHIGHENLEFHRHANIADITYCAAGELLLELPQADIARTFRPGQLVQVPRNAIHRVSHCSGAVGTSTYVLLQLGSFNIEFSQPDAFPRGQGDVQMRGNTARCYLGEYRDRVKQIDAQLRRNQPPQLSSTEYSHVLAALVAIDASGVGAQPEQHVVLAALKQDCS